MTWMALVFGAALGAPMRYLLDRWVTQRAAGPDPIHQFPWGLLAVNVLGSGVAGVLLATTTGDLRVLLLSGFCGAFTTFSGFAWETERLWSTARSVFWAAVVIMPAACLAGFMVSWRAADLLVS